MRASVEKIVRSLTQLSWRTVLYFGGNVITNMLVDIVLLGKVAGAFASSEQLVAAAVLPHLGVPFKIIVLICLFL